MILFTMKAPLLLASLFAVSVAAPLSGARHNRLVKAMPGVDATVAKSPTEIRLWFAEPPELAVTQGTGNG